MVIYLVLTEWCSEVRAPHSIVRLFLPILKENKFRVYIYYLFVYSSENYTLIVLYSFLFVCIELFLNELCIFLCFV